MLTIQILDGGETFFRALDRSPLTLGSSSAADVQLRERDVAELHARIEPIDGETDGYKIVDLGSAAGTLVNDEPILQWRLALGDRVQLGCTVLVVGQRVERPVTATDVLERRPTQTRKAVGPVVTSRSTARERVTNPAGARRAPLWIGLAVLLGGVAIYLVAGRGGDGGAAHLLADLERRVQAAEFDDAERLLALLRVDWAGTDPARTERLASLASDLERMRSTLTATIETVQREASTKSRAAQVDELRDRHSRDPDGIDGRAARIVLARLDELRLAAPADTRSVQAVADAANGTSAAGPTRDTAASSHVAPRADQAQTHAADRDAANGQRTADLESIQRRREAGDLTGALRELEAALAATGDDAKAAELRDLRAELLAALGAEAVTLVARARSVAASETASDIDSAIALLAGRADDFPVSGGGQMISSELLRLRERRRNDVAARQTQQHTDGDASMPVDLTELDEAARLAEQLGDFVSASEMLAAIAERGAINDPKAQRELGQRRFELDALAALEAFLAERAQAKSGLELPLRDAQESVHLLAEGQRLRAGAGRAAPWERLALAPLGKLLDAASAPPDVQLGLATLAYRVGDRNFADGRLVPLFQHRDLGDAIHSIVARGRGDLTVDARGYRVVSGAIVAIAELEMRAKASQIERRLESALGRDAKARATELEALLAQGPEMLETVVFALRDQLARHVTKVENHAFQKTWQKVAEQRVELDRRRKAALDLIFDEKRYFSPFKPPAVSGERAAEYNRVQQEIDGLVRAVDQLWSDDAPPRRVPRALQVELERIDWLLQVLEDFGDDTSAAVARLTWARTLPSDGQLTLRNFCFTPVEREQFEHHERVRAWNAARGRELDNGEFAQVQITNEYRELLGRRPLAIHPALCEAARGHALEMAKLGYFSHFSPTPGRETPFERMRLAGYEHGVSENIANHPSASSAHHGWTHSSGHHRNLLVESHREFGIGSDGRLWVQNFGHGDGYRQDPRF